MKKPFKIIFIVIFILVVVLTFLLIFKNNKEDKIYYSPQQSKESISHINDDFDLKYIESSGGCSDMCPPEIIMKGTIVDKKYGSEYILDTNFNLLTKLISGEGKVITIFHQKEKIVVGFHTWRNIEFYTLPGFNLVMTISKMYGQPVYYPKTELGTYVVYASEDYIYRDSKKYSPYRVMAKHLLDLNGNFLQQEEPKVLFMDSSGYENGVINKYALESVDGSKVIVRNDKIECPSNNSGDCSQVRVKEYFDLK